MINWRVFQIEETPSTNILAKGGRPGDVFCADFQTAGRGRLDHKWLSTKGKNLMMSVVLDVSGNDPHEVATFPLVVGLAVITALKRYALDLKLKWPNDILASDKKLAGILCERNNDSLIAGIGVNILERSFPAEIAARATSLAILGAKTAICDVRDSILEEISRYYEMWSKDGFRSLWKHFVAIDYLKGREVQIFEQDDALPAAAGICSGIQENGTLLVNNVQIWAGEAHVKLG